MRFTGRHYDAMSYKGDSDEARRILEWKACFVRARAYRRLFGEMRIEFRNTRAASDRGTGDQQCSNSSVRRRAGSKGGGRESDSTSAGAAMSSATEFPNT